MEGILEAVHKAAIRLPKPPSEHTGITFSYGTAGFRMDARYLRSTLQRTGILAALRSAFCRMAVGIVVTASHNPAQDNGVKMVDPDGGMLARSWEEYANALANAETSEKLEQLIQRVATTENLSLASLPPMRLLIACDTRPSGELLVQDAIEGFECIAGRGTVINCGRLTTPQLHWMVRAESRGEPASENDYYKQLCSGWRTLRDLAPNAGRSSDDAAPLLVDAANGIGGEKLAMLQTALTDGGLVDLSFDIRNRMSSDPGQLNNNCGADFVQKERKLPQGFDSTNCLGQRCVSLDGDADRLVYFALMPGQRSSTGSLKNPVQFLLLDGDKIATLAAMFIVEQLKDVNTSGRGGDDTAYGPVSVGVVQTAYANGASTSYIKEALGLEVVMTSTGVKYLHEAAKAFDVGIYFEANGHGTILFSSKFISWLQQQEKANKHAQEEGAADHLHLLAVKRLLAVSQVMNQGVGDALSGVLLVEAVLSYRGWSIKQWDALYTDLPSRMLKVTVANRSVVQTANAETVCVQPQGLQEEIDKAVAQHKVARAFVRPSGTEDVIRVFAEASVPASANVLAHDVALLVYEMAGGVGPEP